MSDQTSATGSSANTPATDTATAEKQFVENAVLQVKESRAKEQMLKGKPELAKVFRDQKPAAEVAAPVEAETTAPPVEEKAAEEKPAVDPVEAEKSKRAEERRKRLEELARSGRDQWQRRVAEKQESSALAKQRAEIEARAKEIEEQKAQLELAKKDPFKYLEQLGVPPEELARRVIQRGDPKSTAEEVRKELEEFKRQQLEAAKRDEEARVKRAEEDRRAAAAAQARAVEQRFVQMVSNADRYPSLNALYEPHEILQKAHQLAMQIKATDPDAFYDDSEIADYLEQQVAPRVQKLRGPTAPQQAPAPKSTEQPTASVAQPDPGPKSRTLTSELQSESAIDLAAFKKLPRAKQNQVLGELLKKATASKGAK